MEKNTQFKIDSIEELKEAYEMFRDRWDKSYDLQREIRDFIRHDRFRYVCRAEMGFLLDRYDEDYKTIPSPLKSSIKVHFDEVKPQQNKYTVFCNGAYIDVYDVLHSFNVTCPATAHAIKKLLKPGERRHKNKAQDLQEAIDSIKRAIELI